MGKKFYIGEIPEETLKDLNEYGNGSIEIVTEDVIDEETLRERLKRIITADHEGWCLLEYVEEAFKLILDPPKEEDEWETWANDCPLPLAREDRLDLGDWLRKMPRGK